MMQESLGIPDMMMIFRKMLHVLCIVIILSCKTVLTLHGAVSSGQSMSCETVLTLHDAVSSGRSLSCETVLTLHGAVSSGRSMSCETVLTLHDANIFCIMQMTLKHF